MEKKQVHGKLQHLDLGQYFPSIRLTLRTIEENEGNDGKKEDCEIRYKVLKIERENSCCVHRRVIIVRVYFIIYQLVVEDNPSCFQTTLQLLRIYKFCNEYFKIFLCCISRNCFKNNSKYKFACFGNGAVYIIMLCLMVVL